MRSERPRVTFVYWGRRGLSRFALDIVRAALADEGIRATVSVSRQNESFAAFAQLGEAVLPIDTFGMSAGALLQAWRIPRVRARLLQHIAAHRTDVVIELMPHVWSSFVAPAVKAAGVGYVVMIHDAVPHPGDYRTAFAQWVMKRTLAQSDPILTLSSAVAAQIKASGQVPHDRIHPLFHPDIDFGSQPALGPPGPGAPLRLAFFGRIMPYKGLPLFLDTVDELRRRGVAVDVGVFGEGALGACAERLSSMGAEVINRWLTEAEMGKLLPRFHAVVLSHIEASQSGVAAAAFGAGLPVIATPVGGLIEQVQDGETGVLAERVDSRALADAAERLFSDAPLYARIRHNISSRQADRSAARFVRACISAALRGRRETAGVRSPGPSAGDNGS